MSIKNKLVTAITTAGLLAGLFGSAFVPVANAAAPTVAVTSSNKDAAVSSSKTLYFTTAVLPNVTITATDTGGNDDGTYELTVAGTTIRSCTYGAGTGAEGSLVVTSTTCTVDITVDATETLIFSVSLNKLAAGSSATLSLTGPSDADNATALTLDYTTLTGVAATAGATTLSASNTAATIKWGYDGNATYGETTDVADTTIGGVDYVAVGQDLGSEAMFGGSLRNGYDQVLTTNTTIIATVSEGFYINCEAGDGGAGTDEFDGAVAAGTTAVDVLTISIDTALFECAVKDADGAEGDGGAYTATITTATGTVIKAISGAFLGEIASVTATAAYTLIPSNGAAADDVFTVVAKDAAGRSYAAADMLDDDIIETNVTTAMKVWDNADTTKADITNTDLVDTDNPDNGVFELDAETCDTDADAGETRSVQFLYEDGAGTTVESNILTITCGPATSTALVVTKLEWSTASSTVIPGGTIKAKVFMATAAGVVPGAADTEANVPLILTNGLNSDLLVGAPADGDIDTCTIVDGGYCEITITAPTTVGTTISLYSAAPTNGSLIRAYVSSDAYEAALTVGPKKLKATADFGPAAGKKKIAFVLENASGTTKTFYRRANASGVATYTLGLRGTWTVYATFGDEISDTGTMRR